MNSSRPPILLIDNTDMGHQIRREFEADLFSVTYAASLQEATTIWNRDDFPIVLFRLEMVLHNSAFLYDMRKVDYRHELSRSITVLEGHKSPQSSILALMRALKVDAAFQLLESQAERGNIVPVWVKQFASLRYAEDYEVKEKRGRKIIINEKECLERMQLVEGMRGKSRRER